MAKRPARPLDSDPDEEEDDGLEADEEEPAARPRAGHHGRPASRRRHARSEAAEDEGDDEAPLGRGWFGRPKRPVYWRARDSLWFEPLVALAIVVLLVVGLWAYTQNWPPVYVVESASMQHGSGDTLGLINTGDLVLAQKVDPSQVVTYVVGEQTGYTTYGEYGDVLLYHPDGNTAATPIIHRAILYLEYDGGNQWSAPSLSPLACSIGSHPYYSVSSSPTGCGTQGISGKLTLYGIGWQGVDVVVPLDPNELGAHSGFLTMGDNNYVPGNPGQGEPDQTFGISHLVDPSWVLGVARGMIPWFGAVKLLLEDSSNSVPSQSWEGMGLTIAGALLAALGVHLLLRRRSGEEDPASDEPSGRRLRGFFSGPEGTEGAEEDGDDRERPPPRKVRPIPKEKLLPKHGRAGGRPRPKVRRGAHTERPEGSRPPEADDL
jgi:signal peptidase